MKKIKLLTCAMLCLAIMFNASSVFALDMNNSTINNEEIDIQQTIDNIFTELNDLALEKKKAELFSEQNASSKIDSASIESREKNLEDQLEDLGVHKLDPHNADDINSLSEIIYSSMDSTDGEGVARAGFDFSILVNVYSIYEYTGTYTINGKAYPYKYVRVVDNKGYAGSQLTTAQLFTLVGQTNTTVGNLLSYNFSFGFSAFLGTLPGGWAIDWVLGNVFTALSSYSSSTSVIYNNNSGIYCANMIGITEMTYYYINVNGTWYDCGSRASNISFARADSFTANIGGSPVSWSKTFPNASSMTGHSWYWYLEEFSRTASPTHHTIGNIKIYGVNGNSGTFTPRYVINPIGLI